MAGLIQRGDIRWYSFAAPDKKRPVLILTRSSIIEFLNEVTLSPITRTIRDIPTEVILDTSDGMPENCAINLDHLQTVSKKRIGPLITTLSEGKWEEVRKGLLFAYGFSGD